MKIIVFYNFESDLDAFFMRFFRDERHITGQVMELIVERTRPKEGPKTEVAG